MLYRLHAPSHKQELKKPTMTIDLTWHQNLFGQCLSFLERLLIAANNRGENDNVENRDLLGLLRILIGFASGAK